VLKLRVEIDQERARRAGVTGEEIAGTLSAYFDGADVTTYREGELTIPVTIRARPEDRDSLDRVRTVEILSASHGFPVPLLQVSDFTGQVEPSRIRRFNQERALTILGKHPDMTAVELYAAMEEPASSSHRVIRSKSKERSRTQRSPTPSSSGLHRTRCSPS
jgi:multidrug efflux pump subunit AcrB